MKNRPISKEKLKQRTQEMLRLKTEGKSHQEIAKHYGISYQRVHQLIGKRGIYYFKRFTETQCIFKGLRDYLNTNQISLSEFIRRIYGPHNYHPVISARYRQYLNGHHAMSMPVIDKILTVTGLTYEQAFNKE